MSDDRFSTQRSSLTKHATREAQLRDEATDTHLSWAHTGAISEARLSLLPAAPPAAAPAPALLSPPAPVRSQRQRSQLEQGARDSGQREAHERKRRSSENMTRVGRQSAIASEIADLWPERAAQWPCSGRPATSTAMAHRPESKQQHEEAGSAHQNKAPQQPWCIVPQTPNDTWSKDGSNTKPTLSLASLQQTTKLFCGLLI